MPLSWWQFPGPNRYLRSACRDVRDGCNIVLCLPLIGVPDTISAIRQELAKEENCVSVLSLDRESKESNPIDILFERFAPSAPNDLTRTPFSLCNQDSFRGQIIIVDGLEEKSWPTWKCFAEEYEVASRNQSLLERTVFIFPLTDSSALDPPHREVLLAVHRYNGYVERYDMLLYAASLYSIRSMSSVRRQLSTAISAELAQWDPELCERLARIEFRDLLGPVNEMRRLGEERGWSDVPLDANDDLLWKAGALQCIDGNRVVHSSFLAVHSQERELNKRLWRAELGVLFPLIEQKRQGLIEELRDSIRLPHITSFGEAISDPFDLEIGHIHAQLRTRGGAVLARYGRQIALLRDTRNALAHFEPVDTGLLLDLTFL